MISYLNLSFAIQLDWLKTVSASDDFEYLRFEDYGLDEITTKLNNHDMFSIHSTKLLINFSKDDLIQAENLMSLKFSGELIIITTNVDKRTTIYKQLIKVNQLNYPWIAESQNLERVLSDSVKSSFGISLSSVQLLKTKNLDFDEVFNQIKLKAAGEIQNLDLKQLEIFQGGGMGDQSMFDAALAIIKNPNPEKINQVISAYGGESIWNTIIWYLSLIAQLNAGGGSAPVKINPYIRGKIQGIGLRKNDLDLIYELEKKVKTSAIGSDDAVRLLLSQL